MSRVVGQDSGLLTRSVAIASDPAGATVWIQDGRNLSCTDTLTPTTIELKFHGPDDIRKIRLRKFGYESRIVEIKSSNDTVHAAINRPPSEFLSAKDVKPELKQLNDGLEKEFEKTILGDPKALRCAPFELDFIRIMENDQTAGLTLVVALTLDRGFGGAAFRLASHSGPQDQRSQKAAKVALENGIADLLARFRHVAAKFPELKVITISCSYSATEAFLSTYTIDTTHMAATIAQRTVNTYNYSTGRWEDKMTNVLVYRQVGGPVDVMEVEDKPVEKVITFVMPLAQIPDTLDKNAISDAVLANGKISLAESSDSSPQPREQR